MARIGVTSVVKARFSVCNAISGSFGRLQFAAGFNHQGGTARDVTLRNLLNGQVVQSSMDVAMTGFIYSLAYQF